MKVHRSVGVARDRAHRIIDCAKRIEICAHIVMMQYSVPARSW